MAYQRASYGPGDIAALPPTIGLTSRAPTIGSEDAGRPIPAAMSNMGGCGLLGCGLGSLGEVDWRTMAIGGGIIVAGLYLLGVFGDRASLMR